MEALITGIFIETLGRLFSDSTLLIYFIGTIILAYLFYLSNWLISEPKYNDGSYNPEGHTWRSILSNKSIPYNNLCSTCLNLMLPLNGLFCDVCALSSCKRCLKKTNKIYHCRERATNPDEPVKHFWTKVSPHQSDISEDDEACFEEYYCAWCQRVKYFDCKPDPLNVCDFGRYKNVIVPPNFVTIVKNDTFTIRSTLNEQWEPIFVLANKKSGSNKGDEILSLFRGLLNPIQVIDLSKMSPEKVVKCLPNKCRLLVAGGDGSVAWVLNTLVHSQLQVAVGILPLGTGNDLSRVLGWGASNDSDVDAISVMNDMLAAKTRAIDRWRLTIKRPPSRIGRFRAERKMYVYNYASIGVDAQVTLDFHRARSKILNYTNRTINYLLYLLYGTQRVLDDAGCKGLEKRLKVFVDGSKQSIDLPPIQSLVLLNIPSWGAGVYLWDLGDANTSIGKQQIDDGKIEIVGISSSLHMATLQCGIGEPFCFEQARKIELHLGGKTAMQVDGEPWMQNVCSITLELDSKATVLEKIIN